MSGTKEQIIDLGKSRDIDLYIGATHAQYDGKPTLVAVFSARVKSPAFYEAILQNLQDHDDNSFVVSINQDPKVLERAISEKILQIGDFVPTYTVNVETHSTQRVEMFDAKFIEKPEDAPKIDVPTYNFHSGGFPDKHVEDFVNAMHASGYWVLVIEPVDDPTKRKMWRNTASHVVPMNVNPKGNRSRRRAKK
jgi:hypothetical protein